MKIGIIGTGNMGRAIGLTLAEHQHQVFFGARDIAKAEHAANLSGGAAVQFGSNQQAADFGEVIYYSPRDVNPLDVLSDVSALDGKTIIDSHNGTVPADFAFEPVVESRAEVLQHQIPRARVVKAFNTITQEIFELANHDLGNYHIACFIASDDAEAREIVVELAASLGFIPVDCGELRQARLLEGAADLIRMLLYIRKTPWASFSVTDIPPVQPGRLGGRGASKLTRVLSETASS